MCPQQCGRALNKIWRHCFEFHSKPFGFCLRNFSVSQGPDFSSPTQAFLFLDDDTKERTDSNSLNLWKKLGWQVKSVTLQAGSEFVTGARLTSKLLKFTPPSWLLHLASICINHCRFFESIQDKLEANANESGLNLWIATFFGSASR